MTYFTNKIISFIPAKKPMKHQRILNEFAEKILSQHLLRSYNKNSIKLQPSIKTLL